MKNYLTEKIEWNARFIFNILKIRLLNSKRDWVMCRIACMGQDVLKCLEVVAPRREQHRPVGRGLGDVDNAGVGIEHDGPEVPT